MSGMRAGPAYLRFTPAGFLMQIRLKRDHLKPLNQEFSDRRVSFVFADKSYARGLDLILHLESGRAEGTRDGRVADRIVQRMERVIVPCEDRNPSGSRAVENDPDFVVVLPGFLRELQRVRKPAHVGVSFIVSENHNSYPVHILPL